MSTNIFNSQRQYNFVLRQFSIFQNKWTIAAAVVCGLLLIFSIGTAILTPYELHDILGFYTFIFFFSGLILASQIFSELHSPHKSYSLLTLPVSNLEKLIGSWLLTSPAYILAFWIVSFIIYCFSFLIAGEPLVLHRFFSDEIFESIAAYMVIQTIFLWGACYFRKNNFLKTVLSLIGLFFVIGMFAGLLAYIPFYNSGFPPSAQFNVELPLAIESIIKPSLEFLYWAVLGPYMLLMTYFTLKERQV